MRAIHSRSRTATTLALVFALASFAFHYALERRLDRLEVFEQYNVVFQADPNDRISAMSHGWGSSGRNVAHPNLATFTSPFVRAIAMALTRSGVTDDEEAARRALGLLIVPIVSAVTTATVFALFLRLGLSLLLASLFTVLGAVSFSPLVFGSIPDHPALSALVIAAAYHLFLATERTRTVRWAAWFAVMFAAAGITITNLAIIAILMLGSMWAAGRNRPRATLQVAAMATGVAILTFASSFAINQVIRGESFEAGRSKSWATAFIHGADLPARAIRFPAAIANTIAPARISTGGPTMSFRPDDRYQFRFTFEEGPGRPTARNLPGAIAVLLAAAGVVVSLRRRPAWSAVGVASAAVLAFNWILHSAWGDEMFLYSQHWFVSLLLLLAIAVVAMKRRQAAVWFLALFVVAVAANSAGLVTTMLSLLQANPG
ncbi:MAG: hypothetical protein OEX18_05925 [Candidatus Krumholzibacteria bacterium]|nr:hypothetical protein [Candidatus Krumholzibacteria bacterium]MDH4336801.1 hypothetical protein [Candidatus Krumholzibacteria bacterium]MDH5269432.1 hypothetical protein [Candidatus Krumholzibacteria bacterium]MDH5627942.1 hypothetical protein [Candidatus Krumholzibacteria bacterium]